jgi:hypothetical protein
MPCLAPDALWHKDIDLPRTLQLEQPFNQQVAGRAIPIQGIGIDRDVARESSGRRGMPNSVPSWASISRRVLTLCLPDKNKGSANNG